MGKEHRVVFMPSGRRGTVAHGTRVLDAARTLGADVDSICGGRARCGRCQVDVAQGAFAKLGIDSHESHVSPPGESERRYAARIGLPRGRRLSCQMEITGDVVIDVPPESQIHKQIVRKPPARLPIAPDPVYSLVRVDVAPAQLHAQTSMADRLVSALRAQGYDGPLPLHFNVLSQLGACIGESGGGASVALRDDHTIVGLWRGEIDTLYGLAVDIGTTTIAVHLCDLFSGAVLATTGAMNPQIRYGEDLMSRVSYVQMNPDSLGVLVQAVRRALQALAQEAMDECAIAADRVLEMVAVGNPVMQHLLLGLDPTPLGVSPFALAINEALSVDAHRIDLRLAPAARLHMLPCIAGHVGADAAGVLLSERPDTRDDVTLIMDVGTNAEIMLGNSTRLLACSSPTGPAFEGGQISAGQRAAPGAIERLRIDPATLEASYRIIGCDLWSDEDGFDEQSAQTGITGICGSGIIEAIAQMYLRGIITPDGLIDGALQEKSPRIVADGDTFAYEIAGGARPIRIIQIDVRNIQLAKAAARAGARLLMDKFGVDTVDRIVLAGAFGSHIDPKYAMTLGLIPDCRLDRVFAVGNAAGAGARAALVSGAARRDIAALVQRVEKIETAVEPRFQEHFIAAMAFPHKSEASVHLADVVHLPEARAAVSTGRRRRRRRRATGK